MRDPLDPPALRKLDAAIDDLAAEAFRFLERLVELPSTVGQESAAQRAVAAELDRLGFETAVLPVPGDIGDDPAAGVPQASYAGRGNVAGHLVHGDGPSLLLNGHIDVVPAEAALWSTPPFTARRVEGEGEVGGWLVGRGAGDMKGGFALGTLAVAALQAAVPGWLRGRLSFVSVIEEECTGNGTLAAARDGLLADAVVALEPTGLGLLLGGVGILWVEVTVPGLPAHAESAHRAVNPAEAAMRLISPLKELEAEMAAALTGPFAGLDHACNVNVGVITAGDWPSSVPGQATLGVRVGFPPSWTPGQALDRVRHAVHGAVLADPWLRQHPPRIRPHGFRAEGYLIDPAHPLVAALAAAHAGVHGTEPARFLLGSTTDARIYLNQFGVPAVAYGPVARNIHAVDEAVELASIVAGARTLARFLASYYAAGGLPAGARP
jgi:acetylornithine deacetylase